MKLPQEFLNRMRERLQTEFEAFLHSYDAPPLKGLKVNTLKVTSEKLKALFPLSNPVPWARDAYYNENERSGANIFHFAGLFYLQEPSAMCAAPLLGAERGEKVLDLCAAPGGKSLQLACDMAGEGVLVLNEINYSRAKILSQNVERLGIRNAAITCAEPKVLAEKFPAYFDKILVDAPCSGEGMFKKEENAATEWSEKNVLSCARRQAEILDCAAQMLAEGGKLVYSTCTFSEEEDEWQTESFLKRHKEFELLKEEKLYPHKVKGEGHYAALFQKREGERREGAAFLAQRNRAAEAAFEKFCESFLSEPLKGKVTTLSDGRMYLYPENFPSFSGLKLLRLGLEIGEWDGKLFFPAHALALATGVKFQREVPLGQNDAQSYLRGEVLQREIDGWCVPTFEGFPLGLCKGTGGVLKNHYPKALRLRS